MDLIRYSNDGVKANDQYITQNIDLGNFHIYHPLTLTDYQPNHELEFPLTGLVPAFLYHYAQEYQKLLEFDAGIALVIDVGIDIAFFFAFGGLPVLNSFKYLNRLSKLGQAIRSARPATKMITPSGLLFALSVVT